MHQSQENCVSEDENKNECHGNLKGCNARRANTCAQNITKSFIRLAIDNRISPISLGSVWFFLVCFSMIVGVCFFPIFI